MQLARSPETYCRRFDLYLVLIGLVTLAYGLLTARLSRSWVIADWLINYKAGFVRRGLAGQVAYFLGQMLHLSPVIFVVFFYLSTYMALLLAVRSLARHSSWNLWVLAVLLSPATFAFQVLDPTAGFRKEVLYLASLALFAALLQRVRWSPVETSVYISVAILVSVLTHESLFCFAPYFFAALVLSGRSYRQAAWQCLVPFVLGLGAVFLSSRHLGNSSMATQICSSLGYPVLAQGNEICSGGAIPYLASAPSRALEDTRVAFHDFPYLRIYLTTGLLALTPLVAGSVALARAGRRREVRAIWAMVALSFAGSLILFLYATDWGRWIYIHIVSIAVLLLFIDGLPESGDGVPSRKLQPPATGRRKTLAIAALGMYATLWTLPHVLSQTPRFGYIDLVRYVLTYSQHHRLL